MVAVKQLGNLVERPPLRQRSHIERLLAVRVVDARSGASSATLLLLTQRLVCCIDRLNPRPKVMLPTFHGQFRIGTMALGGLCHGTTGTQTPHA